MLLSQLDAFHNISILCHDNPDADALASGYGLYAYFKHLGKDVQLIYSGSFKIQKTNLVKMIELLDIPITYYDGDSVEGLLITVDCQYGSGNVSPIKADEIAIMDHHQQESFDYPLTYICSYLGSCSTLVWQLLKAADFPFKLYPKVATALYYGLYTDTNQLNELYHPLDKDMRDELLIDEDIIRRLKNSNLSLEEIEIAGLALIRYSYDECHHYALVKARPCDPNILGIISDMMLEVDCVDTCVVYNVLTAGIKLSIRSCIKEVRASELAAYLTEAIGSGGGHLEKAGGFINRHLLQKKYDNLPIETYLMNRLNSYYNSYEIIEAASYELPMEGMQLYQKSQVPVGFVVPSELLQVGTPIVVRTLEGDVDLSVADDFYIMVGIDGEVYPIHKAKFEVSYTVFEGSFQPIHMVYFPSIKNKLTGETISLKHVAKACLPKAEAKIYAKQLQHTVKVFTLWSPHKYMLGQPGDYIARRFDDPHDIYVIKGDIFLRTYQAIVE